MATLGCGLALSAQAQTGGALNRHLRLNQIQMVGTAESYKLAPSSAVLSLVSMGGKKDAEALDFSEPPIADQLDAGARSLSFDIAYDPRGGLFKNPAAAGMASDLLDPAYVTAMSAPGFKVIHVLDVDYNSSCVTLKDCLGAVAAWSRAHKDHTPLVIMLRTNDEKTPMPGATRPLPFDAAAFAALEDDLKAIFKPSELITPDQVKDGHATLREAVLATDNKKGGWPTLAASRGKVMLVLDDSTAKAALYAGPTHTLDGKAMFVTVDEASPLASVIAIDDPVKEAGRIAAAVKAGFIVRTRADSDTVEARAGNTQRRDQAFASGAQIIQTDFLSPDRKIGPYQVSVSDPRHVQCDASVAPDLCSSAGAPGAKAVIATATAR